MSNPTLGLEDDGGRLLFHRLKAERSRHMMQGLPDRERRCSKLRMGKRIEPTDFRMNHRFVQWNSVTVHETSSLDSKVVTRLDEGCEVSVAESVVLASGRERCRLASPVEGWVSARFLSEQQQQQQQQRQQRDVMRSRQRVSVPLSEAVLTMIGRRQGNGACFECGAKIIGLKSADGESAWADCGRGVVLCGECGEKKRAALHLRLDAFCEADIRAMLAGGNQQLRLFCERHPDAVEQYAATLAAEAGPRMSSGVMAAAAGELRVSVGRRFSIVETHGQRSAVQASQNPELLVGDYIVGVGQARVWRFSEVVYALEHAVKSPLPLLISRVPIEHPEMCVVTSSRTKEAQAPMEMAVSGGGPSSSSYAGHAVVLGYWKTFGDQDNDATPAPAASKPQVRRRKLAALFLGRGAPLRADVYRRVGPPNGFASAVLHHCRDNLQLNNAVVVGVNDQRSHLQYEQVLSALNELRRPVLLLLAVEPQQADSAPPEGKVEG